MLDEMMTETLLAEYRTIIGDLGMHATDEQIGRALVERGDWTEDGSHAVVMLARKYGVFVLRNALALSDAMGIEDGESGL